MKSKFIFHVSKATLRRKTAGIGQSMFALSDSKELLRTLLKEAWRIAILSLGRVKVSSRITLFNNFMQHVFRIFRHHGASFTIKWLKGNSVALQRFLANSPYKSLREAEPGLPLPRLKNGLPGIIPSCDRNLIRNGHPGVTRFWLSLFGVYRILSGPVKPNLVSITEPSTAQESMLIEFKWFVFHRLWKILPGVKPSDIRTAASYIVSSSSAGPNFYRATLSYFTDLCWWAQSVEDCATFQKYCRVSNSKVLYSKFDSSITLLFNLLEAGARIPVKGGFSYNSAKDEQAVSKLPSPAKGKWGYVSPGSLNTPLRGGQLAFKEEAAGKLRVFAIADIWTQSVLAPLHNSIFRVLRKLPNDGTFNQDLAFKRAMEKANISNCAFSVDLSSATDRLPIKIQEYVLNVLTENEDFGAAWSKLLVDREYVIPPSEKVSEWGLPGGTGLKYATGQPMGALSSWGMLALTHHLIVQLAADKCGLLGHSWYSDYEVLGDDIVIFDKNVYAQYTIIMERLGVPCNPSKSIPSPTKPVCEFAKRTSIGQHDVSGLSWKEFLMGNNLPGKINMALRLGSRLLISKESLLKAVLVRFGLDMEKPLKSGIAHGLIGLLGSILSNTKGKSLVTAISLLVDPDHMDGEDYDPVKVSIPINQAMQVIIEIMNKGENSSLDNLISRFDERRDFAKAEILPFASQTAYLTALGLVKQAVQDYDNNVDIFANTIIDCSRVSDPILKSQIRSVAEDILLQDKDPQDYLDNFEARILKETKFGEPSLEWSLALLKEATEFSLKFVIQWSKDPGKIPVDNAFALTASRAGSKVKNYWFAIGEFQGFAEIGKSGRDWLRAA